MLREIRVIAQGHISRKWGSWDSYPGLNPKPMFFPLQHTIYVNEWGKGKVEKA